MGMFSVFNQTSLACDNLCVSHLITDMTANACNEHNTCGMSLFTNDASEGLTGCKCAEDVDIEDAACFCN